MKISTYFYIMILVQFVSVHGMDSSIKKQIDELNQWRDEGFKNLQQISADTQTKFAFNEQYRFKMSAIVMQHMGSIPNLDKLNMLQGDCFYNSRKEIIKNMIEKDKVDPNTIIYQEYENPLFESVSHKDREFTQYLWEKGARPDQKTQFMMKFQLEDLEKKMK